LCHFSKRIANLLDKPLVQAHYSFCCNSLLGNSKQFIHTSKALKSEKKKGNYVNLSNVEQSTTNRLSSESFKVKLYPGFQESIEDVYTKPLKDSTGEQFGKYFLLLTQTVHFKNCYVNSSSQENHRGLLRT
jgi:hypothetical protein